MSKFKNVDKLMEAAAEDAKAILAEIAGKQVRLDKEGKISKDVPPPHDGHCDKAVAQAVDNAAGKFREAAIADLSGKDKEDK